ncbi:hypothetical protein [Austwickia sp. TVS 96-490-7B]|uniref:hypothetical protein n=1 Tax=Austwickia sp. TVS 96-490-7B TaxID=2830843 RepID=UPI002102B00F|nr:hypothetical protein [Austwickia sp. TVS 96-490-7B]
MAIAAPGKAKKNADDPLAPLADDGTNNRLYGALLVMRHLLLSIAPEKDDVVDLADFIEDRSRAVVIEIKLGETKFYPAFQFRYGKIVDALAEINQASPDPAATRT